MRISKILVILPCIFKYDESEILGGSIYLKEPLTHELHKDSIIAVKSASMQDKS